MSTEEIGFNSEGFNPITLETMTVKEWLDLNEDNFVILFRNTIYLINKTEATQILSNKRYNECDPIDNEPIMDDNVGGNYFDLKDIGIPNLSLEKYEWDTNNNKNFKIVKDENYPEIKLTPMGKDNCNTSRGITMGVIKPLNIISGGGIRKQRKASKAIKKSKRRNYYKTRKTNRKPRK
jgi:hypothetical protein